MEKRSVLYEYNKINKEAKEISKFAGSWIGIIFGILLIIISFFFENVPYMEFISSKIVRIVGIILFAFSILIHIYYKKEEKKFDKKYKGKFTHSVKKNF